ncbi:hypothetical protein FKP32DRAFT_1678681 [Trametes sanguinea]|nr:hypothetical protein FKP32DRAFT_1678681 [Trametes sanguinea]
MVTPDASNFATMAKTIGAVALGVVLGIMLYGLTIHQVYRYIKMYPLDKPALKMFVALILLLETLHTALWLIAGYHYLIEQPFVTVASLNGHWSVRLTVLITAFTVCTTECYYASRIYIMGPRWRLMVIPAVILILIAKCRLIFFPKLHPLLNISVSLSGFAIAAGVEAFQVTNKVSDFERLNWLVATAYGVAGLTDVILAVSLVIVFHRSRTGSKRMNTVLDLLITYTVNTGVLTSICSMLAFLFAIILPGNLIYAGVSIVGTKLYANSVLAVLNSRQYINERWMDDFDSIHLPELARDNPRLHAQTSTMSWVPATPSTCASDMEDCVSRFEGMTFARGRILDVV